MRKTAFAILVLLAACGGTETPLAPPPQDPSSGPLEPGLLATCSDGATRVMLVVPTPNVTLTATQSLLPSLKPAFTADFTGILKVLQSGTYTFNSELELDGKIVAGPVELAAGEHPLKLTLAKNGDMRFRLEWESTNFKREPVPSKAFWHRGKADAFARVERGRDLVENHNCMGCHSGAPASLVGRTGPILDHVGTRARPSWIAAWLASPGHPGLPKDDIPHVTAYLAGLKNPKDAAKESPTDKFRAKQGQELFERVGCLPCHGDTLTGLGSKTDAAHLAQSILDPLASRPNGLMPQPLINKEEAQLIAEYLVTSTNPQFDVDVPPGDADRGRATVREKGCLNCHSIAGENSMLQAPPFAKLRGPCTTVRPAITKSNEKEIAEFLRSPRDISDAPAHAFRRTVKRLRCIACHELDNSMPTVAELPPPLTDAGNKLRAGWLDAVLTKKKRVRPWMALRMPHFGDAAAPLVHGFAAASGAPAGDGDAIVAPTFEQIRDGVKLLGKGDNGLSCIGCHDFAGRESLGTRGPDVTEMAARMRPEWFRRWMRNPIRLQSGTAMPTYFDGKSDAETDATLDALWSVLSAGRNAPMPPGITEKAPYVLVVQDAPVVIRTMMPDSHTRSIAVGLPGFQSFCFDAEFCALRYAWSGDFLDIAPTWAGRGGTNANVLGKRWYAAGGPLRTDPDKAPTVKFTAYRLDEKRVPEFIYEIDGVKIREKITADGDGLVRSFTLDGTVYFMAGEKKGVELKSSAGAWDGNVLKVTGNFTVTVRPTK